MEANCREKKKEGQLERGINNKARPWGFKAMEGRTSDRGNADHGGRTPNQKGYNIGWVSLTKPTKRNQEHLVCGVREAGAERGERDQTQHRPRGKGSY